MVMQKLEEIRGRTFRNETVRIDWKIFHDCRFYNVVLVFNGKKTGFIDCEFSGFQLSSESKEINEYVALLNGFGLLKIPVFNDGREVPPNSPIPHLKK